MSWEEELRSAKAELVLCPPAQAGDTVEGLLYAWDEFIDEDDYPEEAEVP